MRQPQNICFFNTTKFWGGGEKWHLEAAQLMSKTNNKTFFIADGEGELTKRLLGYEVKQIHISVNNRSFLNPIKEKQLVRFYQENEINTVIFNSPKDLKLGGKAAKKAGVKNIVYRRGIAVEVKKSSFTKKLFKDVVTHFIFNSKATQQLLEKHYRGIVSTKKTAVIYNAIEFLPNIQHTKPNNSPLIIGNAGRLVEQKAQYLLIEIAEQLKQKGVSFKIKIAGEGPLYKELSEQIKIKDLSAEIELLGFVEDMKTFMQKIDVFVSVAQWEGFGFVLAEAMAQKKPILAFNLSSNPELIIDGKNGFLLPPENTSMFADKLALLLNDESKRAKMGEAAYLFAKSNFEKQMQFQKLLDFIL